jgi:hypothetical protein
MRSCFPNSPDGVNPGNLYILISLNAPDTYIIRLERPTTKERADRISNANREWHRMKMAWVIPVHAQRIYTGASIGRLLSYDGNTTSHGEVDIQNVQVPATQSKSQPVVAEPREILWTPETILEMWQFLLQQRLAGRAGPLDIIFSISPSGPGENEGKSCTIKVICDGKMAMKVRALLALFSVLSPSENGGKMEETHRNQLFSPLKDAVLALLDDKGAALLLA